MTADERKAARERCEAATPGPWLTHPTYPSHITAKSHINYGAGAGQRWPLLADTDLFAVDSLEEAEANAAFIAAARTELPTALACIEKLLAWQHEAASVLRYHPILNHRDSCDDDCDCTIQQIDHLLAAAATWQEGEGKTERFPDRFGVSVQPGLYQHHKGGMYSVVCVARDSTNGGAGDRYVVYFSIKLKVFHTRTVAEFCEFVTWPDGSVRQRFERVVEAE